MNPTSDGSSDLKERRLHLTEFATFEDWTARRAFPLAWKVTWISIGVYVTMAVLEFIQESARPGMLESVPFRLVTLLCLVLMTFALQGTFSQRGRDIQASLLGVLAQLSLISMQALILHRPELAPFVILFFLFGAFVLSPALRLPVYLATCLVCDAGTLLAALGTSESATALMVTFSIIVPAQGFLGFAISSQRQYARETWRLTRENHLQATIDSLTRVLNRRAWYERALAASKGTRAAFIMLDIDHFKKVNDTWGHECGDLAIQHVADVMMRETREGDLVGRLGGEEFGILLVGTDPDHVAPTAERIRQRVQDTSFEYGGERLQITVSLGYCSTRSEAGDIDALVRKGDSCLYQAKRNGRNRAVGGDV